MRNVCVGIALLASAWLSIAAQNLPSGPIPTLAKGRLQIVQPATELQVATPNDLVLKVGNYEIKHVVVDWRPLFNNGGGWDSSREEEPEATRRSDGETVISVHPPTLGRYSLGVDVFFEDNKFDVASTEVSTRLPDRNPEKFVVGDGGVPLFIMDLDEHSKRQVSGLALYSDYRLPVTVDAASMEFSLQTVPGQQSPVDFDPKTGEIIARTLGQVVLTVQFGGFERRACINVVRGDVRVGGYSTCPDVVPGGLKWGPDEWGRPRPGPTPTEPPKIKVMKQQDH